MRRRPALTLLAVIGALLASLGPSLAGAGRPAAAGPNPAGADQAAGVPVSGNDADYVIIAGAAGLRWDDIDPKGTPTLWKLAERGAIGSLSVRSAHMPTCPVDGWVTLGAGNYAERTATPVGEVCPKLDVTIDRRPDGVAAFLPDQPATVARQRDLPFGAVPGALAESVRCTTAVGPGAAIAAARPFGRVDRYTPELPDKAAELLSACVLSIVDLGAVDATTPADRARQAAAVDALLARVEAVRPELSTLLIAGLSDSDRTSRLHVVIADGPGWAGGWLTSATTARAGYLQLVDLAPTSLKVLGRAIPKRIFSGHAAVSATGRPSTLGGATVAGTDADRQAAAASTVSSWFFAVLAAVQIALFAAVVPLLRGSYRHAGPRGPTAPSPRLMQVLEVLLIAAALAVPAALIADVVPWWRFSQRGLIFSAVTLAVLAVLTVAVVRLPVSRRTLGPVGVVAAIAAAVVGIDLVTGARLQLNGVAGYSALEGGRYAGLGIVAMGVFIAGALLTAGCIAQLVPHRRLAEQESTAGADNALVRFAKRHARPLVVAGVGAVAVIGVGSPLLGADAGGAVALTAGVCIAAALSTGGWLSLTRAAVAAVIGVAATVAFALIDVGRPVEQQGSLGRFLNQLAEGTSALTVHRTWAANVAAFASSPLTVLALVAAVFMWSVLLRPWGGLKRLYGIYPTIRAAIAGITMAALIAGLLGGAALNVLGAAAATAVPLLTLGALRVLAHAADRTRIVEESTGPSMADSPNGGTSG